MYLINDLETGGTKAETDGILQFGAILCERNKELTIVDEFDEYVYPPQSLLVRPGAVEATGIDTARVYAADPEEVVALRFKKFVEQGNNPRYVGFNAPFDLEFLSVMEERLGIKFEYIAGDPAWICIMRLTRKLLPKKTFIGKYGQDKNPRLTEACERFGIDHSSAHNALSDTHATRNVWLHLIDKFGIDAIPA